MIYQISDIKTKTEPLPDINEGMVRARQIQARLREQFADELLPTYGGQSRKAGRFR